MASVLTALVTTGAIYEFVPADHRRQGYALVMVLAYLIGVKVPTPSK